MPRMLAMARASYGPTQKTYMYIRVAPDLAPEPRAETPVTLEPCEEIPEPGAEMAVCRTMWPDYPCDELGGQGWRVLVLSATPAIATIRFIHARARGRRYEDQRAGRRQWPVRPIGGRDVCSPTVRCILKHSSRNGPSCRP